MSLRLPATLAARGSDEHCRTTLKRELEALDAGLLPLQQGLSHSSMVADKPFRVVVLDLDRTDNRLNAKCSIFYEGIIAGCSCADDPTPVDTLTEYCEIAVRIDTADGSALIGIIE